ncbi:MAG: hypothetical protein QXR34_10850, partial [Saccharolobus sp.]
YRKIYENVKNSKVVPVVARDGLVIIRDSNTKLGFKIDMNDLRLSETLADKVIKKRVEKAIQSGSKKSPEEIMEEVKREYKPEKVKKNGEEKLSLHESVKNALVNIELENVEYKQDANYRCMFCGYPVTDPLVPQWCGYISYGESSLERWNTRVKPLTHLRDTFGDPIEEGLVSCPLCVLDSGIYWEIFGGNDEKSNLDYIIHFYFPLPTHYWLSEYFSKIIDQILDDAYYNEYSEIVDKISNSLDNPKEWYNAAKGLYDKWNKSVEESEVDREEKKLTPLEKKLTPLIDSTWATIVLPTSSKQEGEFNKDLAFFISAIAAGMFFTGLYPAAFNAKVSPAYEKKLLSPVKPLYDFDPTDSKYEADTPLVITTMASLYTIPKGNLDNKISEILRYLTYPFDFYIHILLNHEVGIKAFENYASFRRDPLSFYKKVFPHDSGDPRPPLSLSGGKEGIKHE